MFPGGIERGQWHEMAESVSDSCFLHINHENIGKPEVYQRFRGIEKTHWPKMSKLITNYAFRKRIKAGVV